MDNLSEEERSLLMTLSGLKNMLLAAQARYVRRKHWICTTPRWPGPFSEAHSDNLCVISCLLELKKIKCLLISVSLFSLSLKYYI
jgi:hypothetical protein